MADPMEDFPPEKPRIRAAVYVFVAIIALAVIMLVYTSTRVEAQDLCAPAESLKQYGQALKEKVIWEGIMPVEQGVLEFVLFQNEKGNWTLFVVQQGIACMRGRGEAGTPNSDRGV